MNAKGGCLSLLPIRETLAAAVGRGVSWMQGLGSWGDASAIVLSCPGPWRRHESAVVPVARASLTQVLLGSESQMLAFVAAAQAMEGRLFHTPVPEIFAGEGNLVAACRAAGLRDAGGSGVVHLRFGGVRAARVIKGARNAAVIAEAASAAPLTASHHPFASGTILPETMQLVFTYGQQTVGPRGTLGREIPVRPLPPAFQTADLASVAAGGTGKGGREALDIVTLGEFQADLWAAGKIRSSAGDARLRRAGKGAPAAVLVPWNLDHPGSIVPALLERLVRLRDGQEDGPEIILLPFNYFGPTGIIRSLVVRLRDAASDPERTLAQTFLARVTQLAGMPKLRQLSRVAWVDGNDPEAWWTLQRLAAVGVRGILIDPGGGSGGVARLPADEPLWVEADTRCGALTFAARMPSPRRLPDLLDMTAAQARVAEPDVAAPAASRAARPARRGRVRAG